jgi:hypothetical protein
MSAFSKLQKPNTKIFLGFVWFILVIIFITDRLINNVDIRLFDYIGWSAMVFAGIYSIFDGYSQQKS